MFINHPILDIFDYICAQNAQCWARITKSDMEKRYNMLYEIAHHLDVDVKVLLELSKNIRTNEQ